MTVTPNIIGNRPLWNYGKNASFGLWVHPLVGSEVLVLLYKGVLFTRKTTFKWKATSEASEIEGEDAKVTLEFKQKITPKIVSVGSCGAIVSFSMFPITIFVSETTVLCSDDSMSSFKKFESVSDEAFYALKTGSSLSAFDLPALDTEVYDDEDEEEDTKNGLLIPVCRISVNKSSSGTLSVNEVLGFLTQDTFAFEKMEDDEGTGDQEDPCIPDGGGGYVIGDAGGQLLPPGDDDGADDLPSDEDGAEPCINND